MTRNAFFVLGAVLLAAASASGQPAFNAKTLEAQDNGKLKLVMRPLTEDLKTVKLPDQDEYDEIQSITDALEKSGAKFEPISAGTWQKLDRPARGSLLANYRIARQKPVDAALQEALGNFTSKANLHAFAALAKGGTLDPRIADEFKLPQSKLLAQRWEMPAGSTLTPATRPATQEMLGVNYYKDLPDLFGKPRLVDDDGLPARKPKLHSGCGSDCAVVGSGEPQPGPPGQALAPVIVASLGSVNLQGAGGPARRQRPFNPAGFLEVVRIEYSVDSDSCSGTLLSPTIVLTAAHCVHGRGAATVSVLVPTFSDDMLAKCTKARSEKGVYTQCVSMTKVAVASIETHTAYDSTKTTNDVALLMLSRAVPNSSSATVLFAGTTPEAISMAGYGGNGLPGERSMQMRRALEVGWHSGAVVQAQDGRISWQFSGSSNGSATCTGDSGGPIYAGDYDGGIDAGKHIIFALATAGSQSNCEDFYVTQTPLSLPPIREWLCKVPQVAAVIENCTGRS